MSLLTYKQAASKLHVSQATLRVQALKGRLPTTTVNGRVYIEQDAIKEYAALQKGSRFLKVALQELLAGTLMRPQGVQEDDWRYMIWYARDGVTMQQIAAHYKVSRQRVEQRIRKGLEDAGAICNTAP